MIVCDDLEYAVYWLHDETCTTPELSGYVGITFDLKRRIAQHRGARKLPRGFEVDVLFTGTADECVARRRWCVEYPGQQKNSELTRMRIRAGKSLRALKLILAEMKRVSA